MKMLLASKFRLEFFLVCHDTLPCHACTFSRFLDAHLPEYNPNGDKSSIAPVCSGFLASVNPKEDVIERLSCPSEDQSPLVYILLRRVEMVLRLDRVLVVHWFFGLTAFSFWFVESANLTDDRSVRLVILVFSGVFRRKYSISRLLRAAQTSPSNLAH